MQSRSPVEIADQISRRRAWGVGYAAAAFILVQIITHPFWGAEPGTSHLGPLMWAVNAIALLLLLMVGGGYGYGKEVRQLVNDEVSLLNHMRAIRIGYWIAMIVAMTLYFAAAKLSLTLRETVYLIVTPSVGIALLTFSFLEFRAHRDG